MRQTLTMCFLLTLCSWPLGSVRSQVFIDPGVGAVIIPENKGFYSPRFNIGVHNLVLNRFGFYHTIEAIRRTPDQKLFKDTEQRDIFGLNIRINNFLSFYAGSGMFMNGLIAKDFDFRDVRTEAGVEFDVPSRRLNIDLGYSTKYGVSANIGFIIPFKSKSKVEPPAPTELIKPVERIAEQAPRKPEPIKAPVIVQNGEDDSFIEPTETIVMFKFKVDDEPLVTQNKVGETKVNDTKAIETKVIENKVPEQRGPENKITESKSVELESSKKEAEIKIEKAPEQDLIKSDPEQETDTMKPGIYAVNGVYRFRRNAEKELDKLTANGFKNAKIGYRVSTKMYYVWLAYSTDEKEVKDFVWKSREKSILNTVWLLRVN